MIDSQLSTSREKEELKLLRRVDNQWSRVDECLFLFSPFPP